MTGKKDELITRLDAALTPSEAPSPTKSTPATQLSPVKIVSPTKPVVPIVIKPNTIVFDAPVTGDASLSEDAKKKKRGITNSNTVFDFEAERFHDESEIVSPKAKSVVEADKPVEHVTKKAKIELNVI